MCLRFRNLALSVTEVYSVPWEYVVKWKGCSWISIISIIPVYVKEATGNLISIVGIELKF
jgi:hypothetical protein